MTMPKQKPGKSEQSVATSWDFFNAVESRFGEFMWDLAADEENSKCSRFISEEQNSLLQKWHELYGNLWLNPPFADIEPWARKAYEESKLDANIFMLVPASVSTEWYRDWVHNKAYVLAVGPRLQFIGHTTPYPKDLALVIYNSWGLVGFDTWRWKP